MSASSSDLSAMPLDFESWKHLLGDNENNSNAGTISPANSWQGKSFASVRKNDFGLPSDSPGPGRRDRQQ